MKVIILTANLGNFDTPVDPVKQNLPLGCKLDFHRFTDEDFAPITGLTPRMQYRIPKMFGWEMAPGYDVYIWLDGTFTLDNEDSLKWFLEQLHGTDAAFFTHPARHSVQEEVEHIEDHLARNRPYITSRYKNGLHREQLEVLKQSYLDNLLLTSTAFIYKNNDRLHSMMAKWWFYSTRYYTCDQVNLPYAIKKSGLYYNVIKEDQYKIPWLKVVSKH